MPVIGTSRRVATRQLNRSNWRWTGPRQHRRSTRLTRTHAGGSGASTVAAQHPLGCRNDERYRTFAMELLAVSPGVILGAVGSTMPAMLQATRTVLRVICDLSTAIMAAGARIRIRRLSWTSGFHACRRDRNPDGAAALDRALQEARHAHLVDQRINRCERRRPVLRHDDILRHVE
jgi:hypothetical protein